jgi:hypothetical protein
MSKFKRAAILTFVAIVGAIGVTASGVEGGTANVANEHLCC